MTPDDWTRVPIPCAPGYNNCGSSTPEFTVVYNSGLDRLIITSDIPAFADLDPGNILLETSSGQTGSFTTGDVAVQSDTVIWIDRIAAWNIGVPTNLIHLDFFTNAAVLIGTWIGSLAIASPAATEPVINTVTGSLGHISINGDRFSSSPDWTVNEFEIGISAVSGDPEAMALHFYNPSGPDAGTDDGFLTPVSWANTQAQVDFDAGGGSDIYVVAVRAYDVGRANHFDFDVSPDLKVQSA